ncbi:hypothetical protein [Streptomyces europaeiscabiei]|uniref:hypothetical protein n=1 Tax=Streptomyces europaeiscabiei TaxID=146819 RepID=UPI0038F6E1F3
MTITAAIALKETARPPNVVIAPVSQCQKSFTHENELLALGATTSTRDVTGGFSTSTVFPSPR